MIRTGGQLLVESLLALGATKSFGVPGESYLAVLDALHDTIGQLDYVVCRNEGGAAFMAAAYGKLTQTPGLCFVTRGPGATNASIGVHTAMQDSVPMLLFVGQVGTDMKGREAFQEIDYKAVFGTLAKWAVEIDDVERIPEILSRAWTLAVSGRPGPVVIALPEDMLTSVSEVAPLTGPVEITRPEPSAAAMQKARSILAEAKRPVILYGGCNWQGEGTGPMQRFAEASNIPVVSVFRYQDQFDNTSPVFCGEAGVGMTPPVKKLLREADVILAVNNRFGENSTDGYTLLDVPQPKQRVIHVHGSDLEIGKVYRPELGIHADPSAFAEALGKLAPIEGGWAEWRAEGREAYEAGFELPDLPSPVDMGKVCSYLRDRLPADMILTNGAGNFTVWPGKFFRYGPEARLLGPQSGAMGYGVPAAIAAKIAHPERTVVCFAGDGDFQMNCPELGSAMQAGAQPIILVLNNGIYGTIRAHQERSYPARVSGTTMEQNPDFVTLGRAYGFHSERVASTDEFPAAFERALASDSGALLELDISPEALTPRLTLSQMRDAALAAKEQS
ncbi:thiamine pyrophosphate-binding protein [Halomonas icarae]|uniref:Thiamine pyrophosphate-binding protein n=1 Tax=Halomonas icarae TaxID=2691040 RepID=A0A7X4VZ10_9GAMM|nr:thiamine pyrophosphate-binding protein [Halomonas icarae]MDR5903553.1 thiamine pyrophosphate-binding protein [Halomonas icarae]NAW12851.1 thiamine pyrophosphate-binding protein [Halomonas icarae]